MDDKKRIETITLSVSEINEEFGNPRKISKKKREELLESLLRFGNFGIVVIDENNNVIAGNQRVSVLKAHNPDTEVLCKRLIGYSETELKAINIKDNVHSGEWDFDILADWTADISLDLGIDFKEEDPQEKKIKNMELVHYEKYDYVIIACRNELDYLELIRKLGIEGAKVSLANGKRKIKARAVWYDEMKAQLIEKDGEF